MPPFFMAKSLSARFLAENPAHSSLFQHAMTPSTVRARIAFSFKGESYDLATAIDLERCLAGPDEAPDFHRLLAQAAGIDTYSYLYEVLESHAIEFSEPTGLATPCCRHGRLDWPCYALRRQEARDLEVVRAIAARILGEVDPAQRPGIEAAMLAAYQAGKLDGSG